MLADGVVTLAECLRAQGYVTGFGSNNVHASPFFKMTQGVRNAVFKPGLHPPGMLREFAKWLAGRHQDRPCFAVVVTRDAHTNYDPKYEYYLRFNRSAEPVAPTDYARHPDWLRKKIDALLKAKSPVPPELQRQWIDLYDAELAQLDDALSRVPDLLQAAGRQSNTIIAVIGDHGELFFEHGRIGHSGMPHEPVLHVPLILHGPGIPSGKRIKRLVRSIDLYPTLAALAGASVPHVVQGRSLLPILRGDESALPPMSALASFVRAKAVYHMVRAGDHKLVYDALNDTRQLYDLQRDPRELNNIIDAEPDLAERLNQLLSEWLRSEQALREHIDRGPERELSPEVLEQLRSLGYIR